MRDNTSDITPFTFGRPGDIPLAGDWDGDGIDTIGTYRPQAGPAKGNVFHLRNSNTAGLDDVSLEFERPLGLSVTPLAGDWNRDGIDGVGVFTEQAGVHGYWLAHLGTATSKPIYLNWIAASLAQAGDLPLGGDFDGVY